MSAAPAREVAIVTPWYPTPGQPFRGAFVEAMAAATAPGCDRATVYHSDGWSIPPATRRGLGLGRGERAMAAALRRLLPVATHPRRTAGGADLVHVPVLLPRGRGHAEVARRHAAGLRAALGGEPLPDPVVHGHVGLPGGWAALRNARPDARVYVTEHATFLNKVLAEPDARAMYDELLRRCAGLFAVGEQVRAPLVEAFPHHAGRIGLIANPVPFDAPRPAPVTGLRRWLYVGLLIPRKGVGQVLEAFAACHEDDPSLTLTVIGEGPLRDELAGRAVDLKVAEAVTFLGALPPDEAQRAMREHDLLVHASRLETFGVTVVEAVAAGMPVLVTRCGGPQETLAGVEDAAGELVEVQDGPDSLIAGYRRLRDRFPDGLDPARARAALADRYGYPAVARAHHAVWFGDASDLPEAAP
jgi:glycogen(starch) synthase